MANQDPLTRPTPLPDRSDYFNWEPEDVQWEDSPKDPPPIPSLPDTGKPSAVPDRYLRESGADLFETMSVAEQDERFGSEIASALRDGTLKLSDLVARRPMETESDFISEASPSELGLDRK